MQVNSTGWNHHQHLVLAVSTGIDSMTLLHCLQTELKDTYASLTCLHVNHHLRPQSEKEALFIEQYCDQHHIPLYTHDLDLSEVVQQGISIENQARTSRYQWFDKMMQKLEADVLITAHHLDDQIETIFYRLFTGRSTRSSLGMSYISSRSGYQLCRPLLNTTKSEIRQYQSAHKITYFEDQSNLDNQYVRNDIRNRILPEIESNDHLSRHHLLKLKDWHDEQREKLKNEAHQFIKNEVDFNGKNIKISRKDFVELSHSVKMTVLDEILREFQLGDAIPEKTYKAWFEQISSNIAQCTLHTTDKWIIQVAYDKLAIMANDVTKLNPISVNQPGTYIFGAYQIVVNHTISKQQFPITIRTRNNGDKFQLNGAHGHKKVSRLLIDEKIVQQERDEMPIVVGSNDEILAVGILFLSQQFNQHIKILKMGEE
ncbi:tRNA lysidine(34) synthetase TilS [Staphylococcus hsinchuensis]|uniref:tRNA(Ile)-lysidine synthase n=1 Tax=Staphylococcus hsinchuensis TaxID=3051183 RepID=A0ABZ3EFA9_9STAP